MASWFSGLRDLLFGPSLTPVESAWLDQAKAQINQQEHFLATTVALRALRSQAEPPPIGAPLAIRNIVIKQLISETLPEHILKLVYVIPSQYLQCPEMVKLIRNTSRWQAEEIILHCSRNNLSTEDALPLLKVAAEISPRSILNIFTIYPTRIPILSPEQALSLLRIIAQKNYDTFVETYHFCSNYFPPLPAEAIDILLPLYTTPLYRHLFTQLLDKHPFMLNHLPPDEASFCLMFYARTRPHNFIRIYEKFPNSSAAEMVPLLRQIFNDHRALFTQNLWKYPFMLEHFTPAGKSSILHDFAEHIRVNPLVRAEIQRMALVPAEIQKMALAEIETALALLPSVDDITYMTVLANINTTIALWLPLLPKDSITYEMALAAVKTNPLLLQFVPIEIQLDDPAQDDIDNSIIFSALRQDPEAFKFIPKEFITEDMINYVIQTHKDTRLDDLKAALVGITAHLLNSPLEPEPNRQLNSDFIYPLLPIINDNKALMLIAIDLYGVPLTQAHKDLKNDLDFIRNVLEKRPEEIQHVSEETRRALGLL